MPVNHEVKERRCHSRDNGVACELTWAVAPEHPRVRRK